MVTKKKCSTLTVVISASLLQIKHPGDEDEKIDPLPVQPYVQGSAPANRDGTGREARMQRTANTWTHEQANVALVKGSIHDAPSEEWNAHRKYISDVHTL